jgi:purine-binding chemotaxis protein CheW
MSTFKQFQFGQEGQDLPVVTFRLGDEKYCMDIFKIHLVIKALPITRIPRQPEFMEGVFNWRGEVIPAMDLRKRLGIQPKSTKKSEKIIIVIFGNHKVGFIVDAVEEKEVFSKSRMKSSADMLTGKNTEFIQGLIERDNDTLLMMLDPIKVLDRSQQETLRMLMEDHGGV